MLGSAVVELSNDNAGGAPGVTWVIGCCPTSTSGLPSPPTAFTDTAVTPYPCVYVNDVFTKDAFGTSPSAISRGPSMTSTSLPVAASGYRSTVMVEYV